MLLLFFTAYSDIYLQCYFHCHREWLYYYYIRSRLMYTIKIRFEPGELCVDCIYVVFYVLIGRVSTNSIINLELATAKKMVKY